MRLRRRGSRRWGLATAGATPGYDYGAFAHAAQRLLGGQPIYDPNVDVARGFAIHLSPPSFAFAVVSFTRPPSKPAIAFGVAVYLYDVWWKLPPMTP